MGAGEPGQLRRRIEGADPIARISERSGITTGSATGIEDVSLGLDLGKKPLVDRRHVHADGRAEKFGRELLVVLVGVVHPWPAARSAFLRLPAYRVGRRPTALRRAATGWSACMQQWKDKTPYA